MLYAADSHFDGHHSPEINEDSDEVLMLRIAQHDEAALILLLRRHLSLLRTVIMRVINNDADVDDLVQEISCEVWRQANHFVEEKGKAVSWLITLCRRRAIDKLRRKQTYFRLEERLLAETKFDDSHRNDRTTDCQIETDDHAALLERIISTLPDAQQEALKMCFYGGLSQREISRKTGVPLGTIKTRLELAIRKVKTGVLALGGTKEWTF